MVGKKRPLQGSVTSTATRNLQSGLTHQWQVLINCHDIMVQDEISLLKYTAGNSLSSKNLATR